MYKYKPPLKSQKSQEFEFIFRKRKGIFLGSILYSGKRKQKYTNSIKHFFSQNSFCSRYTFSFNNVSINIKEMIPEAQGLFKKITAP